MEKNHKSKDRQPVNKPFLEVDPNATNGFVAYKKSADKAFQKITNFENLPVMSNSGYFYDNSSKPNPTDNIPLFKSALSPIKKRKENDIFKPNINEGKVHYTVKVVPCVLFSAIPTSYICAQKYYLHTASVTMTD